MALDIKTIKRYRDYMACVRKWEYYDESEKEQLRQWYKNYYSKNQEKERERYREYYHNNADSEKARIKQHCINKKTI